MSEDDILLLLLKAYKPVLQPTQIAERAGISNTAVSRKLDRLEERGHVESGKVGRTKVYWITESGERHLDEHYETDTDAGSGRQ